MGVDEVALSGEGVCWWVKGWVKLLRLGRKVLRWNGVKGPF